MLRRIHINIGSNRGHRSANIERAVAALASVLPGRVEWTEPMASDPWGYESDSYYLNVGLMAEADESEMDALGPTPERQALALLALMQRVEHEIDPSPHRDADGNYIDRAIDIDFIAMDFIADDGAPTDSDAIATRSGESCLTDATQDCSESEWRSSLVMTTPQLTLPHPRMHLRDFVLRPLLALDPTWRHPLLRQSAAALLTAL